MVPRWTFAEASVFFRGDRDASPGYEAGPQVGLFLRAYTSIGAGKRVPNQ